MLLIFKKYTSLLYNSYPVNFFDDYYALIYFLTKLLKHLYTANLFDKVAMELKRNRHLPLKIHYLKVPTAVVRDV